jgi:hypothetical protein
MHYVKEIQLKNAKYGGYCEERMFSFWCPEVDATIVKICIDNMSYILYRLHPVVYKILDYYN